MKKKCVCVCGRGGCSKVTSASSHFNRELQHPSALAYFTVQFQLSLPLCVHMIQHRHVILISHILSELFAEKTTIFFSVCIKLVLIIDCELYDHQVKMWR